MSRDEPRLVLPVSARDHVLGPADAPVTLVEYGDFECPNCRAAHEVLCRVLGRVGDRVRMVWRHFPMENTHPHARAAALASEAAAAQGRFWPMHDRLLDGQGALEPEDLAEHAAAAGLDVDRFARDLRAGTGAERIREDFSTGVRSGVNGTPTFFVNGLRHDGGYEYGPLLAAIESALPAATG